MKNLLIAIGATCLILGGAKELGKRPPEKLEETWLTEKVLESVGDYQVAPKEFGSKVTYRMSDETYEVLDPIGISCQIFESPLGKRIDVVIIAGHTMQSFHDQQVCFKAQGWNILKTETRMIETESHGKIPASWMTIEQRGESPKPAMYLFRTPKGFDSYQGARWGFLVNKIEKPFETQMGYSYRFIGLTSDVTDDELIDFAADYLDELDRETNGVM